MSAAELEPCDCLNDCGDDHRVKSGKVKPCEHMVARMERDRIVTQQLATITALRATYGADNIIDLIEKMHAEVLRLDAVQRSVFHRQAMNDAEIRALCDLIRTPSMDVYSSDLVHATEAFHGITGDGS